MWSLKASPFRDQPWQHNCSIFKNGREQPSGVVWPAMNDIYGSITVQRHGDKQKGTKIVTFNNSEDTET